MQVMDTEISLGAYEYLMAKGKAQPTENHVRYFMLIIHEHIKARQYWKGSEFFVEHCTLAAYAQVIPASKKQLLDFLNNKVLHAAINNDDRELGTLVCTVRNILS